MDAEHSTSRKPDSLPCMFTIEELQESQEPDSQPSYIVRPTAIWNSLQRFKQLQLRDLPYHLHDTITVSRHDLPTSPLWTGTILEIRGHPPSDQAFIRLYWFYHSTQLPPALQHPYHGRSELLASNAMAIINVTAITRLTHVHHWHEEREAVPPAAGFFWRQTYNVQTQSLSPLHTPCPPPCILHHNPDNPLIPCRALPACSARMHKSCLQAAPSTRPLAEAEAEAEPEAEMNPSPPNKKWKKAAAAASARVPPRDKKRKKEEDKDPSSLLLGWKDEEAFTGTGEEVEDGHDWLEDKHCLGCGGSLRGW